ncbi:hypothetical protein K380107A5_11100 [Holdemania massiliensis]
MKDEFCKNLYATYLSYLLLDEFSYPPKMNKDSRNPFTELIKTIIQGQISVNISHPGIAKEIIGTILKMKNYRSCRRRGYTITFFM